MNHLFELLKLRANMISVTRRIMMIEVQIIIGALGVKFIGSKWYSTYSTDKIKQRISCLLVKASCLVTF